MFINDDIDKIFNEIARSFFNTASYRPPDTNHSIPFDNFTDGKFVYLTFDLKLNKEDINTEIKESNMLLHTMNNGYWNKHEITFPKSVRPNTAKSTLNNGILDIKIMVK